MAYQAAREAARGASGHIELPVFEVEGESLIGTFTPNG